MGRAVQEARTGITPTGNPTWQTYTVFADLPATVLENSSSQQR
jgi:hypothetical protein